MRVLATQQLSEKQKTEISPAFRAEQWFQSGNEAFDTHEYEKAVTAYQKTIRLKPYDAATWNNLGNAYIGLGQYDQAVGAYQEAIRLKPDDADAWNNLTYALQGDRSKVMQVYEKLKTLDPNRADRFFQKVVLP